MHQDVSNYKEKHFSRKRKNDFKEKNDTVLHHHQQVIFVITVAVSAGHALIFSVIYALTIDKLQIFVGEELPLIDCFEKWKTYIHCTCVKKLELTFVLRPCFGFFSNWFTFITGSRLVSYR